MFTPSTNNNLNILRNNTHIIRSFNSDFKIITVLRIYLNSITLEKSIRSTKGKRYTMLIIITEPLIRLWVYYSLCYDFNVAIKCKSALQ